MADTLAFRFHLERSASFTLDMGGEVPLRGVTAVSGPSGSGKTTLLRALAGLDARTGDTAEVRFRGQSWDGPGGYTPPEARRIGFVFQEPYLFTHMSVEQNLRYGAKRRDVTAIDGIVEALDLAPLLPRGVDGLSGGEARRVALGRALAANPQVLFLDEPLSGLDADRKAEVLPYLARAVGEAQVPALYVTHATDEIATLADRTLLIDKGRISGWRAAPFHLIAGVVGHEGEDAICEILTGSGEDAAAGAGARLRVPVRARMGERVRLGVPRDALLISVAHPGPNSALAVLPARIAEQSGPAGPVLDVFGQRQPVATVPETGEGGRVWLSVLRVLPRPERDDSDS
ncbi:ATP-binding cassette domain-containing protein [Alphaproteobacteria bacterium GH1-50]|uniref:ATP-binding cassette domain-containing protein n=1 Tax=Kangsaoukella pontilimi TaxID=2691042 RepID=A0A7C9IRQ2_9RHOB|nr:ATP-binding cassette domain-containing protein [Kangsaoukella pontilimi]MXQ07185.1 ATP-binding cassette domain-containing protein [Kangsaoukella pontilimi]